MSLPRYPSYKDSGVPWLGHVPDHWEQKRLRHLTECLDGRRIPLNASERADRQGDVPYWGANSIVGYVNEALFDEDLVFLGEDGAPFFDPAKPVAFFSKGKVWPNNHIHVLRPLIPDSGKFLVYILNATDYSQFIDGSTRDKLTQSSMNDIPLPWPTPIEREIIADFLDHETAKIDALVAEQQRLLELLKEKRQAVISHAVTKGLNPDAPVKDSGVEWLGQVPAHWTVQRFGNLVDEPPCYGVLVPDNDINGIPMMRITDIHDGIADRNEFVLISKELSDQYRRTIVEVGDVVLSVVGTIGESLIINDILEGVNLSRALARIQLSHAILPDYFCMIVRSLSFNQFVDLTCVGSAQRVLNMTDLRSFRIAHPETHEQKSIVRFVEDETQRLEELIIMVLNGIELLKERRAALISAAVTGQIDVRNWEARESA